LSVGTAVGLAELFAAPSPECLSLFYFYLILCNLHNACLKQLGHLLAVCTELLHQKLLLQQQWQQILCTDEIPELTKQMRHVFVLKLLK
jgi:hypothetical protein